ncbi:hypothetical protein XOC_0112 [Xanthomonas oryzae pv. oryzicola BLS256]|uniref:Uncharacterized protein n=1 Tax=Xanthomonas oryzae pv. oryzicola (strain BLS256) TaxID=383407 RepID=G7TIS7_XANOB|nr:hypothetical protein XOC_0112 [Xanthomonas oryzae pv. oryzicola BLS256]QEO99865.1 hypothetical protein XOCgx_4878 [Xanthomonas oryzae pv. oryzicola]
MEDSCSDEVAWIVTFCGRFDEVPLPTTRPARQIVARQRQARRHGTRAKLQADTARWRNGR